MWIRRIRNTNSLPSTVPYRTDNPCRDPRIFQDFSLGLRLIRNQLEISEGLNHGSGCGCGTRSPCIPQSFGMQNLDLLKLIKSIHKNYDDFTNLFQVSGSILTSNKCGSSSLVDPVTPNFLLHFRFFLDIPFVITSPTSVQPFQLDSQAKVSFQNILGE
jgi:hypothetical protein